MLCVSVSVATAAPPPLRVVYFVTQDRQPLAKYEERLDRVMKEVQRFYRESMTASGFTNKTFALETNAQGRLRLHLVRAAQNMEAYGRNGGGLVRQEVKAALALEGININSETILIFQTLLKWDGTRAIEIGPFVGGGTHLSGTAWVYDDERLDPDLLSSKASGGYYGHPCSIGEFNSHYIGGVAHELGHALSLPHICETRTQHSRGSALMGGGNHTYGNEKRGEGKGTFLHPVSAMLLANIRPFAGDLPQANRTPKAKLAALSATFENGRLILTGKLTTDVPLIGVGAYDDWAKIPADYDAVGWLGTMGINGQFRVVIEELRPGNSQLRLAFAHVNGARSVFPFDYSVDAAGRPDTSRFEEGFDLDVLMASFLQSDRQKLTSQIQDLQKRQPKPTNVLARAYHLQRLLTPSPLLDLAAVPTTQQRVSLSSLKFAQEKIGWGTSRHNCVIPNDRGWIWLQVGGQFFAEGLFAHAPALHSLELTPGWKIFHTRYGLQDGAGGSVVFVIRGDGKELFRSQRVADHQSREIEVSVAGVRRLELMVEDAGDGANSDWGVWLAPELRR